MDVSIGSTVTITIVDVKDSLGNQTALSQKPSWTFPTSLSLIVADDGMSAGGVANVTGQVVVSATADGITASATLDAVAGQAVTFKLDVQVTPPAPAPTPAPAPAG